jgi:hypothetical protein
MIATILLRSKYNPICYLAVAAILVAIATCGCSKSTQLSEPDPQTETGESIEKPEIAASNLVARIIDRYKNADAYSDGAKLALSYTLQGQPFKEYHSCEVNFQKPRFLKASFFQVRVVANSRRMVSYVFDSETFNLDSQHIVKSVEDTIPISQLLQDSIWRHYACGSSELPVSFPSENSVQFMSPVLAFFSDTDTAPWFTSSDTRWDYIQSRTIDGKKCWGLKGVNNDREYRLWVDRNELLLRSIQLPSELLTGEGLDSALLDEMTIMIELHNASWQSALPSTQFEYEDLSKGKPVGKFIPVPEKFPTPLIGEPSPAYGFDTANGGRYEVTDRRKISTVILWSPVWPDEEFQNELRTLAGKAPKSDFLYACTTPDVPFENVNLGASENMFAVLDPNGIIAQRFGLSSFPALVVVGPFEKVQYAQVPLDSDWPKKILATLKRIEQGEDVATEMKNSYGSFVKQYHEKIAAEKAAVSDLLNN